MLSSEGHSCSMVQVKESSSYDDSCSRASNEDSLLSAENSPNITSPASSIAGHSVTGYSLESDEGVDMSISDYSGSVSGKRMLYEAANKTPQPDNQLHAAKSIVYDENTPLDLSTKNPRKFMDNNTAFRKYNYGKGHVRHDSQRRIDHADLDTDEMQENKQKEVDSDKYHLYEGNKRELVSDSRSLTIDPRFLSWTDVSRSANIALLAHRAQALWNPAFLSVDPYYSLQGIQGGVQHAMLAKTNPSLYARSSTQSLLFGHPEHMLPTSNFGCNNDQPSTGIFTEFSRSNKARHAFESPVSDDLQEKPLILTNQKQDKQFISTTGNEKDLFSPTHDKADSTESRKRKMGDTSFRRNEQQELNAENNETATKKSKKGDSVSVPNYVSGSDSMLKLSSSIHNALFKLGGSSEQSQSYPKTVNFKPCRFHCDKCGRTYATAGGLLKHSKSHRDPENPKTFTCKTCEKEYTSLGALKMHIRTHTLPCKCHICGKAFSRTWLLQGHIRTHTGEKPYQCSVCFRAFADRSNLRAHMQTHETVKRYACTGCGKTFSRISLLNRHHVSGCTPSSS